jgi:hypothetical protein
MTFLAVRRSRSSRVSIGTLLEALTRRPGMSSGCGHAAASHLHRVGNGCVVGRDPLLTSTHLASPDPSATCLNTLMI